MKNWTSERLVFCSTLVIFFVLSLMLSIAWYSLNKSIQTANWTSDTHIRLTYLERILSNIASAEAEQRGYLLTPSAERNFHFSYVLNELKQNVKNITDTTVNTPNFRLQIQPTLKLIEKRIELFSTYPDDGRLNTYAENHSLQREEQLTKEIHSAIEKLVTRENQLINQRKQSEYFQHQAIGVCFIVLLTLLGLALAYLFIRIRKSLLLKAAINLALQKSEARYRNIVETANEGIWITDSEGRISFANQRMAEMLGYSVEDLLGKSIFDFMEEDVRIAAQSRMDFPRKKLNEILDFRLRHQNGTDCWVLASMRSLLSEQGEFLGILGMLTDITDRKKAEQQLREAHDALESRVAERTEALIRMNEDLKVEISQRKQAEMALWLSEENLKEIIDAMPIALFLKDAASRIILMNKACEVQWGMAFSNLRDTDGSAFFPPQQIIQFLQDDKRVFTEKVLVDFEEIVWNAELQENRIVRTLKKPIFDQSGHPRCLIGICIDITESKRASETLQHSLNQLRLLSDHQQHIKESERKRIARDIHDELGQNLLALKIDASMLFNRTINSHPKLNQRTQLVLNNIDATIKSVKSIINDLRPATLELGLCAAIEWQLNQFSRTNGITSKLLISEGSFVNTLDETRTAAIFRIVQESLVNIVRHANATSVEIQIEQTEHELTMIISDDGIGIQSDDCKKNNSFGLIGIKERITSLKGELIISQRNEGGTTLSIVLPLSQRTQFLHAQQTNENITAYCRLNSIHSQHLHITSDI